MMKKLLVIGGIFLFVALGALATTPTEYLQKFDIDELCIAYTKNNEGHWVATIFDPELYVHVVVVGSRVGKNWGVITKMTNDSVDVIELVLDPVGAWIEKPRTIKVWRNDLQSCLAQRSTRTRKKQRAG